MGNGCFGPGNDDIEDANVVIGSKGIPLVKVGKKSNFSGKSKMVKTNGIEIAVFKHQSKFYALDNACYHNGGGLLNGDIEVLDGKACVVCPWHGYRITLEEGEGIHYDAKTKMLKSKGCKQRAHQVIVSEDDELLVEINTTGTVDSDHYQRQK